MTYAVLLRFDPTGPCPVILRDDSEPLPGGDGVRYRLITQTEDHAKAMRVLVELRCRIAAGEPQPGECERTPGGRHSS